MFAGFKIITTFATQSSMKTLSKVPSVYIADFVSCETGLPLYSGGQFDYGKQ